MEQKQEAKYYIELTESEVLHLGFYRSERKTLASRNKVLWVCLIAVVILTLFLTRFPSPLYTVLGIIPLFYFYVWNYRFVKKSDTAAKAFLNEIRHGGVK